jgi:hypothetical protein
MLCCISGHEPTGIGGQDDAPVGGIGKNSGTKKKGSKPEDETLD